MFVFGIWEFLYLFCGENRGADTNSGSLTFKTIKMKSVISINAALPFTVCLQRCVAPSRNAAVTTRQAVQTPPLVTAALGRTAGSAVTALVSGSSKSSNRAGLATTASPGLPTSPPSPRTSASYLLTSFWLQADSRLWRIPAPAHKRPFTRLLTPPAHLRRSLAKR